MRRIAAHLPTAIAVAAVTPAMAQPDYAVTARIPSADGGWDYATSIRCAGGCMWRAPMR